MSDRDELAEIIAINWQADSETVADAILAAGWIKPKPREPWVRCDDIHPKYGRCIREAGHAEALPVIPGTVESEPSPGGHYTCEHEDERRPDGTHPWDY